MERKKIVVTGMGAFTPLGNTPKEFWSGLVAGRSGIGPMTLCDPSDYPCQIAGEVNKFDPGQYLDLKETKRMARFSQLAVAAAIQAVDRSRLIVTPGGSNRIGVILGNGNGGFPTTESGVRTMIERGGMKVSPFFMPMILPNMAASNVSRILGIRGYNSTVVTACSASNQAMGEALEVLSRGVADVMITGGTEAGISHLGLSGFCSMRALSTNNDNPQEASRPFDAKRDGFVPAEGAAILILETEKHAIDRGANILCELAGFGSTSDAFHPVQPEDSGDGAMRAMQQALEDAGITTVDVDYINAHGTSTPINDAVETTAIKRLFENRAYDIPVSSTKSMIGHSLGASGALEAIPCIYSIVENVVHPTINYQFVDPKCDLDYVPNQARKTNVDVVLSNSFGFGGQNACIVFRRYR